MHVFQEGSLPGNARKKMSFVLYSDHPPPPQVAVSVPAPKKAIPFPEEPGDPGGGTCDSEVTYTFFFGGASLQNFFCDH